MPPAEAQRDRDGNLVLDGRSKPRWHPHLDFRDDQVRARFQDRVLAALRSAHPDLFVGESVE